MIPFTTRIQQQCQSKAKPANQEVTKKADGSGGIVKTPFQKGRCYDGWKPNPDGRPASQKGSCVEE